VELVLMSDIRWADDALISAVRITDTPRHSSATGYGRKIPTRYQLKYENRWHRVYMMQYGNAGPPTSCPAATSWCWRSRASTASSGTRDRAGPDVAINTLKPGDRFRFPPRRVVCTLASIGDISYRWNDYNGYHSLYAGSYAGTWRTAWPHVYPTDDPETVVTTGNGEFCAEHAENGSCIHSDHTR
jgi:hypothetical protein